MGLFVGTVLIFLAVCATTMDVPQLQTVSFDLRVFTSKAGGRNRNKWTEVMGQIDRHKSNFHFFELAGDALAGL